jgi:diaminopimelate decarboxylase
MNHFEALAGDLACEAVPLARIAEAVGTPAYIYSTAATPCAGLAAPSR